MSSELLRHQLQGNLGPGLRIEHELGEGGMSRVFAARQGDPPRDVVVKVLDPELAKAVDIERFRREIQVAAHLRHPGIVPVIEACQTGTLLYYTMPMVRGDTLRAVLHRTGPLAVREALDYVEEIGAALACAHAHNVVHRDIKPENILVADGHAVVTDFGIARAIEHAADLASVTSTGLTVGTPRYMSPEQAAADKRIDGRSDIYSLACVLYEMLAGEPPFPGNNTRLLLARHMHQDPPRITVVRPDVPAHVEAALLKALQKIPAARFATVEEFLAALGAGSLEPAPRRGAGRMRRAAIVGAALALAAAVGVLIARAVGG